MMSAEEWGIYLRFLRGTAVAQTEAGKGLQDITEAACKRIITFQSEPSRAAHDAAIARKLPPLPLPSKGIQKFRPYAL